MGGPCQTTALVQANVLKTRAVLCATCTTTCIIGSTLDCARKVKSAVSRQRASAAAVQHKDIQQPHYDVVVDDEGGVLALTR